MKVINSMGTYAAPLVLQLGVVLPDDVSPYTGLEVGEDLGESFIPHFFKQTQTSCFEEHFGVTNTEDISDV